MFFSSHPMLLPSCLASLLVKINVPNVLKLFDKALSHFKPFSRREKRKICSHRARKVKVQRGIMLFPFQLSLVSKVDRVLKSQQTLAQLSHSYSICHHQLQQSLCGKAEMTETGNLAHNSGKTLNALLPLASIRQPIHPPFTHP